MQVIVYVWCCRLEERVDVKYTQDTLLSFSRGPSCVHRHPVNNYLPHLFPTNKALWSSPFDNSQKCLEIKGISVVIATQHVKENKPLRISTRNAGALYTNRPFSNSGKFRWSLWPIIPKHVAQTVFFSYTIKLLYTLILHKQIFAVSNAWISIYAVICLQKTASFSMAFIIYNRVRTSTATAKVMVTTCVTVLPSVHRFQNVDLSSIVTTNGRWLRFTNSNGQWICIRCMREKKCT